MGCSSSKEDSKPADASAQKDDAHPQPMRKVRTNFSDVNYTDPSTGRRDTVYAPSEVPAQRPSVVPEVAGEHRASAVANGSGAPLTKGAVSGDGAGNVVVGGDVVGEEKAEVGGEGVKSEVPWDALSPGSKAVA